LFDALAELGAARMSPPRDMRAAAHRLAGAVGAIGRAHDLRVGARGDIPRGVALIVSNHVSYLDPLAILPVCPAIPLSKSEVASWPIIGPIGSALGVAYVERADGMARARVLRRVHDLLASGVPVLNFPEGTTTNGIDVAPFIRGTFGIATLSNVPIVPMAIRYRDPSLAWTGGATFFPHYIATAKRASIDVELSFGAPLAVRANESPAYTAVRARAAVVRLLRELQGVTDARERFDVPAARAHALLPTSRVA
jgi:1-acyl-sn-glycerol-3-phosphate acyltransferase